MTSDARRANMRAVRSKDTGPEMIVRRLTHQLGFRFRLHRRDLPGTPDLAFIARRRAIFVHGCFWHGHDHCPRATRPKGNAEFWRKKLDGNRARDARQTALLAQAGWTTLVIWECETKALPALEAKITSFLSADPAPPRAV